MEPIEIVRCFIAVLYLAMKGKVNLEQIEEDLKIMIRR
jgi:chromatin segregation and condensation protein Rec8/ScpA/Scc1 (kleisin family)